ncbi:MAG: SET domain-containing protein [Chlamydiae bacterium]|nr:SET domain-containing protein [Chlamydiota bacterium]
MPIEQKFRMTHSTGIPWIHRFLQSHQDPQIPLLPKKAQKALTRISKEIILHGIPSHLQLAYVHPHVNKGVFLREDASPIRKGSLIGAYTGAYELVPGNEMRETSYCYDVVQEISLTQHQKSYVVKRQDKLPPCRDYSIQTNALRKGNFTRFINHSSLEPNIEARLYKLPQGEIEVFLFAKKEILPGEQLLSNYGGSYWHVLPVIPSSIRPTTYQLQGHRARHLHPEKNLSPGQQKHLLLLRNPSPELEPSVESSWLYKKLQKELPALSLKQQNELDTLEEILLERGLPRRFTLIRSSPVWTITLEHTASPIYPGEWVAPLAGTLSFTWEPESLCLTATTRKNLFLLTNKHPNAFTRLPRRSDGNLALLQAYHPERKEVVLIAYATQVILPGDKLVLQQNF